MLQPAAVSFKRWAQPFVLWQNCPVSPPRRGRLPQAEKPPEAQHGSRHMIQRWQRVLPLRQQPASMTYGPGMGERGSPAPVRQQVSLSVEHSLCTRPAAPRPPQAKAVRPRSSDKATGV